MNFRKGVAVCAVCAATLCAAQAEDLANSSDHPDVGRFPQSEIRGFETTSYSEGVIPTSINSYDAPAAFEAWHPKGQRTTIVYDIPASMPVTTLEIVRSVKSSLQKAGFSVELVCHASAQNAECGAFLQRQVVSEAEAKGRFAAFKDLYNLNKADFGMISAQKGDLRLWSIVAKSTYSPNIQYAFDIYEEDEAASLVLEITPEQLRSDIGASGSARLQGVTFETNSAKLTKESAQALAAISAYIQSSDDTRFVVVGHTDNQGAYDHNKRLSEARAQSVRTYLVESTGISADRLRAVGVAYAAPIANNDTAEGRALNRRVELVKGD
ncbi:membrane protein [Roseobacter cerasinus]|uniref:Membrane protein n=1 Tax=Roseobacter cerasinus TaxID=2602289 RepID=A0A640VTC5_9RHOB|nr:OmpA family protein [Roseobacter cerasinus]GFE51638.1 membrane protein [Roseobacter cerasinus]